MKKVALLFVLAVIVPSVVLAVLAARTLRDQQFVIERQQTLLYQNVTDSLAKEINDLLSAQQQEFKGIAEGLLTNEQPRTEAMRFDHQLRTAWPMAEVGFAVTVRGTLLAPSPTDRPETRLFCVDNAKFLANRESVEVYWNDNSGKYASQTGGKNISQAPGELSPVNNALTVNASNAELAYLNSYNNSKAQPRKVSPAQQTIPSSSKEPLPPDANFSKVVATEAEFRQLIGDATDGLLARFLQNKLRLMFWHRLERDPELVLGAQVDLNRITGQLRELVAHMATNATTLALSGGATGEEIVLAILDDNTRPLAKSEINFEANWKRPFVATEIGEALPHWEVAAYLKNPDILKQTARTMRLTLGLLIFISLAAVAAGSWLIVADLKRQMTLARQKTDFVSNVSHELKTPLTSIRMFAELLAEERVTDREKQKFYLHIITSEAARLTRLINNVLDFSRLERGEKKYTLVPLDLASVVRETVATYRPHLETNGFRLDCELPTGPVTVQGDRDALAQIAVNLLSNAEKYANGDRQIRVELAVATNGNGMTEMRVMDRGPGVPRALEEKIFEQFFRVPDSLASGIQGSGLGLTLARQIARAHGGDVIYAPREGGGSVFTVRLPVLERAADVKRL